MDVETARKILQEQLALARAEERIASDRSDAVGLTPHPNGIQRLQEASRDYAAAREKVLTAMKRLTALSRHGTIPEDIKKQTVKTGPTPWNDPK